MSGSELSRAPDLMALGSSRAEACGLMWEFPKEGGTFLGVLIIRILLYGGGGIIFGSPIFGNPHVSELVVRSEAEGFGLPFKKA